MVFLLLFGMFMFDFFVALFVLYPRAGNVYLPFVMPMNSWYSSLMGLFELAFTGSPSIIDLEADFTVLSSSQASACSYCVPVWVPSPPVRVRLSECRVSERVAVRRSLWLSESGCSYTCSS